MFSDPDQWTALLSALALGLSLISLVLTFQFNRRAKQAELQDSFHGRFDRLQEVRTALLCRPAGEVPDTREDHAAHIFFDRFWSLQLDQYTAWQHRFVAPDVFRFWVFARWRQLRQDAPDWTINGRTVASTFDTIRRSWSREPEHQTGRPMVRGFLELFEQVRAAASEAEVDRILAHHAPELIPG